jgi:hypothetical protein
MKQIILVWFLTCLLFSTERNITTSVEVTEEYINQELKTTYTETTLNIPDIITNTSVIITLPVPTIDLNPDEIVFNIPFNLRIIGENIEIGGFSFDINEYFENVIPLHLTIPSVHLNALEIIAFFEEDVPVLLEEFIRNGIDELFNLVINDINICELITCENIIYQPTIEFVIDYYNDEVVEGLTIYQRKLIQSADEGLPENFNGQVTNTEPGYTISDGFISFDFSFVISASPPTFQVEVKRSELNVYHLRINSPINTNVKIYYQYPPNSYIDLSNDQNIEALEIPNDLNIQVNNYEGGPVPADTWVLFSMYSPPFVNECEYIEIYFEGPFGWFLRKYSFNEPESPNVWYELNLDSEIN